MSNVINQFCKCIKVPPVQYRIGDADSLKLNRFYYLKQFSPNGKVFILTLKTNPVRFDIPADELGQYFRAEKLPKKMNHQMKLKDQKKLQR